MVANSQDFEVDVAALTDHQARPPIVSDAIPRAARHAHNLTAATDLDGDDAGHQRWHELDACVGTKRGLRQATLQHALVFVDADHLHLAVRNAGAVDHRYAGVPVAIDTVVAAAFGA